MQTVDPIMLALLGFVLLFVPITGGLMAATPYLMPKRECFAVTIPDAASNDPEIKHLKRSYFTIVIVATLAFTAFCGVCICLDPERAFLPALVVSVLIICYVATLTFNTLVKRRTHEKLRGAGKPKQPSA